MLSKIVNPCSGSIPNELKLIEYVTSKGGSMTEEKVEVMNVEIR